MGGAGGIIDILERGDVISQKMVKYAIFSPCFILKVGGVKNNLGNQESKDTVQTKQFTRVFAL